MIVADKISVVKGAAGVFEIGYHLWLDTAASMVNRHPRGKSVVNMRTFTTNGSFKNSSVAETPFFRFLLQLSLPKTWSLFRELSDSGVRV